MEDPVSGADAYSEWQERLKRFDSSGLSIDVFCREDRCSWAETARKNLGSLGQ